MRVAVLSLNQLLSFTANKQQFTQNNAFAYQLYIMQTLTSAKWMQTRQFSVSITPLRFRRFYRTTEKQILETALCCILCPSKFPPVTSAYPKYNLPERQAHMHTPVHHCQNTTQHCQSVFRIVKLAEVHKQRSFDISLGSHGSCRIHHFIANINKKWTESVFS